MHAPIAASLTVTTPGGLLSQLAAYRTVEPDPLRPLGVRLQTDTLVRNGRTTTTEVDGTLGTITTTSPAHRRSVTRIDASGRVTREEPPGLEPVAYAWDASGRLASITQGTRASSLTYDAQGQLTSISDPLGRTTAFAYSQAGRVLVQSLPDGREIRFAYDAGGNLTSLTPPGKPAHGFAYTPVDLQQAYTPPEIGSGSTATVYSYNLDKQLTTITRPDGEVVSFSYDAAGRLAGITAPHGQSELSYHPTTGQLATITAPGNERISFSYDGFLETGVAWSGTVSGSLARTYDSDFRVVQTSVNGAGPVAFQYDADGLLTKAGTLTLTRSATTGQLTATSAGVVADSRATGSYGELAGYTATVSGAPVYAASFTRDALGRITQKVETIQGQATTYGYGYDQAARLTQVTSTPQGQAPMVTSYAYDANGNRLSRTDPTGTVTAGSYDDQDRLLAYGDMTYTYSANGDLTSKTENNATVSYEHDVFGNLRHVLLDNGIQIDYVIDGRNRRIGKKINGSLVQGFLYDDQLRPIAELDGSGTVVSRFVYGTHVNVPELIIKGSATYRILTDHLGSPRLVINTANGSVAQRMDFDEFGNVILDTNPGFQPFSFAGGLHDTQTKLVRFGARDYDAQVGRWPSKDPILFQGHDSDLFSYVFNDPVNLTDSAGVEVFIIPGRIPPFITWCRRIAPASRYVEPRPFEQVRPNPVPVPRWLPDPNQIPPSPSPWWETLARKLEHWWEASGAGEHGGAACGPPEPGRIDPDDPFVGWPERPVA